MEVLRQHGILDSYLLPPEPVDFYIRLALTSYLLHPISSEFESGQPIKEFEKGFFYFFILKIYLI